MTVRPPALITAFADAPPVALKMLRPPTNRKPAMASTSMPVANGVLAKARKLASMDGGWSLSPAMRIGVGTPPYRGDRAPGARRGAGARTRPVIPGAAIPKAAAFPRLTSMRPR